MDSREHLHYMADLVRYVEANPDECRALAALTDEDRAWLGERGWREPDHATFVRLSGLDVDRLALTR